MQPDPVKPDPVVPFRRVRDLGDVLNVTFVFLRHHFVPLAKALLFIVGPPMLLMMGLLTRLPTDVLLMGLTATPEDMPDLDGLVPLMLFLMLAALLVAVLPILVINGYMAHYQEQGGGEVDVMDVWDYTRAHFLMMLGTVLFLSMLFFLAFPILLLPCLGALAYLVGGVYFGVSFLILLPMRLFEGVGLLEGIQRARGLVQPYWWLTFGVLVLAWITYLILGSVFQMPAILVSFMAGMNAADTEGGGLLVLLLLLQVVSSVGTMMVQTIPLVAATFQYFNLVERHERTGLMERIERVEGGPTDGAPAGPSAP